MNQSRIKSTMARLVATPEPLSKEEKKQALACGRTCASARSCQGTKTA
ncbi:MAG: hypothetical protein II513_09285 [Ruminococcus sp.]|nr:hypothetical protein [Ruminococcus sp.]